jgi:putative aldouronate transport system substrate-binding protein
MGSLNRRDILRLTGVAALAGTAGPALVSCGSGNSGDVSNKGKDLAPFPTYMPFDGPEPDLPGDENGLQAAYLKYPSKVEDTGWDTPGDGSEVRVSVMTYGVPPNDVETDEYVQAVHKALGIKLKLDMIPAASFGEVMATNMTDTDIPDIIMFGGGGTLPNEQEFVQASCMDISDFISGDNVKDYPGLANIPPHAWEGLGRIGGKLYGIPIERPIFGGCLMVNRTAFDKVDAPLDWTKDEYLAACGELSKKKKYGLGLSNDFNPDFWAGSFGAPNVWSVEGGKFVSAYTTDAYKDSIAMLAKQFADGHVNPDSPNIPNAENKINFAGTTVACYRDGWGGMGPSAFSDAKDGFTINFGRPMGPDAVSWAGEGRFGYVAFKKADKKRVKMLLKVCSFLAAPFGTKQFELFNYGVEDKHFTRDDNGAPKATKLWETSNKTNYPVTYIASAPIQLFYNGYPEETEAVYEWEKVVAPITIPNPSNGLRSATWTKKGAELEQKLTDAFLDVIYRGKDKSYFEDAMKSWMNDGGADAAKEFQEEYEATQG